MFNSIEFKMADNWQIFTSIGLISGKPCSIARPSSIKQNVWFQGRMQPKINQRHQIQNAHLSAIIYFPMPNF